MARPAAGRRYRLERVVRLGDVGPDGRLRLDALARYLQDVAGEDAWVAARTTDLADLGQWVVRRTAVVPDGELPRLGDAVTLVTWCSGTGARWAERRTDLEVGGGIAVRAGALWVHVDPVTGRPRPLPARFDEVWDTAGGRRVGQRLRSAPPPAAGTRRRPFPLRAVDVDVLGHVNNAVYWAPVVDELTARGSPLVARAVIEFRGGLDRTDPVTVAVADRADGFDLWLTVAGEVRATTTLAWVTGP